MNISLKGSIFFVIVTIVKTLINKRKREID